MEVKPETRDVATLIGMIGRGEIRLPEIQREYVWKPTQVAKLIESLYLGYPTGSLLLWKTPETPVTRNFATATTPSQPVVEPLYLLDGQQRLTALRRALSDDPGTNPETKTEIVFNIVTEAFQNQSAATSSDPRWVKVRDVTRPGANLFALADGMYTVSGTLTREQVGERLQQLANIRNRKFHMEVLVDASYKEVTDVFVRVNSGGRPLRTSDLALASLSPRWPGVVGKLETEASYWRGQDYDDIDFTFLTRALTGAVLGHGLSAWSPAQLAETSPETLEQGWQTVRRGLRRLVPLLKNNLRISHSRLLPSMVVLLPLIMLLGERADEPLPPETADALLYWLLVATIRNRYSGATDTKLGQDIPAARAPDPARALLANLGIIGTRVEVTPRDLAGRSVSSPYFMLSYLVAQENGARDWWHGTTIAIGGSDGQQLEYHHIHPQATLRGRPERYTKGEINDLANLAFISARANKRISDRSPAEYFPEVGETELAKHFVPLDARLRRASTYRGFLAARRELLAATMTAFLNKFRPAWLDGQVITDPLAGSRLDFTLYYSDWDAGRMIVTATHDDRKWTTAASLPDLESAIEAAAEGLDSDVLVGRERVPAHIEDEELQIRIGPFLVTGTVDNWRKLLDRERGAALPLSQAPSTTAAPWEGDPITFPITSID